MYYVADDFNSLSSKDWLDKIDKMQQVQYVLDRKMVTMHKHT